MFKDIYKNGEITEMAKALYHEEREIKRLDGWFLIKEIEASLEEKYSHLGKEEKKAHLLCESLKKMPLSISDNAIFVGTQRDAFAKSYALINPHLRSRVFRDIAIPRLSITILSRMSSSALSG